jgi:phosphosulfolactate phosphohydrolase-like enzyme
MQWFFTPSNIDLGIASEESKQLLTVDIEAFTDVVYCVDRCLTNTVPQYPEGTSSTSIMAHRINDDILIIQ